MSAIYGVLRRDGFLVALPVIETMRRALSGWVPDDRGDLLLDGSIALGWINPAGTSKTMCQRKLAVDDSHGIIFAAAGRIDNRDELMADIGLGISENKTSERSDGEIFFQAYLKWGENSPARILGDWAFVAYNRKERRLFLARDHFGVTSLYYHADPRVFVFATSRAALLALNLAPREMDELYLAQVLVSWPAYHGDRTIRKSIKRLPPGHFLSVTPERIDVYQYWRLEDTPELRLTKRADYVEAFRGIFDQAVRCRLRSADDIAVSLSGGLDSGSVAATAAHYLQCKDARLSAFTSAPLSGTEKYVGNRFGDELSFARATACCAGNIDLYPVTSSSITPIQAICHFLPILDEPSHSAGNLFWIQDLLYSARKHGCRTLLTGQMGNGGISWPGDLFSQSIGFQLRSIGWRRWSKEAALRYFPHSLLKMFRNARRPRDGWWRSSVINPRFADRLDLFGCLMSAPDSHMAPKPRNPLEQRCRVIRPGRSLVGATWAEIGARYGMEVCDPTADVRVLVFSLSVPDHIFIDPKSGLDRWLIREAMKGRLPDDVRLNRRRGRQAGDLVFRLRSCANEVEDALEELGSGPAVEYVNVPYMREIWSMVRTDDTPQAFNKSMTILTRGIMAGLWVNGFFNAS